MPHGFPKVGSRERIFLVKGRVLGTKILKICVLRAEILGFFFLKIENGEGSHERRIDGKLVS